MKETEITKELLRNLNKIKETFGINAFNEIMNEFFEISARFNRVYASRENWRKKCIAAEKEVKSLKMDNAQSNHSQQPRVKHDRGMGDLKSNSSCSNLNNESLADTDTQHIKSRRKDKDESLSDVANVGSVDKYSGIAESSTNANSEVEDGE